MANKTLLIVEDCNKQDEKGRKRKVKGGKYERRMKKCQGTHKKEEKIFLLFEKRLRFFLTHNYFSCLFISFLAKRF
ncbi:MAG: hypothetical protein IKQ77_08365 [Prevotella sp.]|nr:hypothetical protein [Prevotella sp.]